MRIAGLDLHDVHPVTGGDICASYVGRDPDGRLVFAKTAESPPSGFFAAERAGLERLRVPEAPPVPEVLACGDDGIVLEWVDTGRPSSAAAERFGESLARMHRHGAAAFGADKDGFIGLLPLPNARAGDWPEFYADQRLRPFLPGLPAPVGALVESVCRRLPELGGPACPPARVHGDLWSGNLLWSVTGGVWVVDAAAAHDGHPESDLAMLALFGAPHLEDILRGYARVRPLAASWRARVPLHQLHPLLVHAQLFGGGYVDRVAAVAEQLLRS